MIKLFYMITIILTIKSAAFAYGLDAMLEKGPVLSVNRTADNVFDSVLSVTVINAPFDLVWEIIMDIDNYKNYMDRVVKAKITDISKNGSIVTAEFEIDAPFFNMKYVLKHVLNKSVKKIEIFQIKGDLEGSSWKWEFEPEGEKTTVYYSGKTINFSSFLQRFEDKSKTVSMGINIASVLETLNNIKRQSEKIFIDRNKSGN